jgi:hypothetical protein
MAIDDQLEARIGEALADDRPISARLARRLAEAAFGYMGLGPVYLAAAYEPIDGVADPYDVICFRSDWAAAERYAAYRNTIPDSPRYGVFGPYDTELGGVPLTSQYSLDTISLLVDSPASTSPAQGTLTIPASDYDSLFWTRAAVEKFAVPYYAALYSPAFAEFVLEEYDGARLAVLGHMPWSEYTELSPPPMILTGELRPGPIPVLHHLDEHGRWHRKPLYPGAVGKK